MAGNKNTSLTFARLLLAGVAVHLSTTFVASNERSYSHNLYRSWQFKCKEPQPRAFVSTEIIKGFVSDVDYVQPAMTVLHRCDGATGCCLQQYDSRCTPDEEESVKLGFKVEDVFADHKRMVTIMARNHTACKCKRMDEIYESNNVLKGFVIDSIYRIQ